MTSRTPSTPGTSGKPSTPGKPLLWAAAGVLVVAVLVSVVLSLAGGRDADRAATVVLLGGFALAAILGVAGMLSLRRRPHSGADDILP